MRTRQPVGWPLITAIALSSVLSTATGSLCQDDSQSPPASSFVGLWQGFTNVEGREIRVEIEISKGGNGELVGVADLPDTSVLDVPLQVKRLGHNVTMTVGFSPLVEGRLNDDLRAIEGRLFVGTMGSWIDLVLEKDNPAFRRFALPRLADSGEAQREYSYRPPSEADGGWLVSTLPAERIDEQQIEDLVESVLREEQGRPEAILIARNGKLVLEEYFYGFTRDRIHSIQSITKSVTSLLFGIAQDRGLVGDVGQPVYRSFPEYQDRQWIKREYPIALFHLLTMSAAIEWTVEGRKSASAMYRSGDAIGYVLDLDQVGEPGKVASYNSGLSMLLGSILRSATGEYVDEFAEATLFADLGVSSYRWQVAADGTRNTVGGLTLAAYDLAKMGQLVLSKGVWNGKRVVSESWIKESTKRHLPLGEESIRATRGSRYSTGYGYQWWYQTYDVNGTTVDAIAGLGHGGQYLGILPTLNTVIVLNNGEWGDPSERVFDYNVIVEKWILPAIR